MPSGNGGRSGVPSTVCRAGTGMASSRPGRASDSAIRSRDLVRNFSINPPIRNAPGSLACPRRRYVTPAHELAGCGLAGELPVAREHAAPLQDDPRRHVRQVAEDAVVDQPVGRHGRHRRDVAGVQERRGRRALPGAIAPLPGRRKMRAGFSAVRRATCSQPKPSTRPTCAASNGSSRPLPAAPCTASRKPGPGALMGAGQAA